MIVLAADADGLFMGHYDPKTAEWWLVGVVPSGGVEITHWRPLPATPRAPH
jgi:hypothetical protein